MSYINIIPVYYAKGNNQKSKLEDCYTWVVINKLVLSLSTLSCHNLWNPVIPECCRYKCTSSICFTTVPRCRLSEEHFMKCFVKNNTFDNLNQNTNTLLRFYLKNLNLIVSLCCNCHLFLNLQILLPHHRLSVSKSFTLPHDARGQ